MLDAADDAASRRRGAVSRLIVLVHTIRHQMRCLATEASVTRMRLSTGLVATRISEYYRGLPQSQFAVQYENR